VDREYIYVLLYVDLLASKSRSAINMLKSQLSSEFEKDLGEVKRILDMKIDRDSKSSKVCLIRKGICKRYYKISGVIQSLSLHH